jgi:hypothetical protein
MILEAAIFLITAACFVSACAYVAVWLWDKW